MASPTRQRIIIPLPPVAFPGNGNIGVGQNMGPPAPGRMWLLESITFNSGGGPFCTNPASLAAGTLPNQAAVQIQNDQRNIQAAAPQFFVAYAEAFFSLANLALPQKIAIGPQDTLFFLCVLTNATGSAQNCKPWFSMQYLETDADSQYLSSLIPIGSDLSLSAG